WLLPRFLLSPRDLAPTEDQGEISFYVESAPDASVRYTADWTSETIRRLLELPEAYLSWEISLPSAAFGGLVLKDYAERQRSAMEMMPEVYGIVREVPGVRAFVSLAAALPGAANFDVEMVVTSTEGTERMAPVAESLVQAALESKRFMFADTDLKIDVSQARVEVDRNRVADLGLDLAQVGEDLGVLLAGGYVNRFDLDGRSYKGIPPVGEPDRQAADRLPDVKSTGPHGRLIPVSSFARIESRAAPRALNRLQQRDSFNVTDRGYPAVTNDPVLVAPS